MKAMVLEKQGDIGSSPLQMRDVPEPEPASVTSSSASGAAAAGPICI